MSDAPPFLFPLGTHVRHKKTGGIYSIVLTPTVGRLEATNEPAYSYTSVDGGPVWHRSQTEMEDGRFETYLIPTHPINH